MLVFINSTFLKISIYFEKICENFFEAKYLRSTLIKFINMSTPGQKNIGVILVMSWCYIDLGNTWSSE